MIGHNICHILASLGGRLIIILIDLHIMKAVVFYTVVGERRKDVERASTSINEHQRAALEEKKQRKKERLSAAPFFKHRLLVRRANPL